MPFPPTTARVLREHRVVQDAERERLGQAWTDLDLVSTIKDMLGHSQIAVAIYTHGLEQAVRGASDLLDATLFGDPDSDDGEGEDPDGGPACVLAPVGRR